MIYLDMDGVFVDWESSTQKLFPNVPLSEVSKNKIWKKIDHEGHKFWANMDLYPWALEFIKTLQWLDEVFICSSPSLDPSSVSGKLKLLHKIFNRNYRNYIFTPNKYLLSKPGDILIDDKSKHVDAFSNGGGCGILFPRPWNRLCKHSDNAVNHVIDQLKLIYPPNRFPSEPEDEWSEYDV